MRSLLLLGLFLLAPMVAIAHPVPRDNHDRTLVIRPDAEGVTIDYRLEVDEFRALRDLEEAEVSLIELRQRSQLHELYRKHLAGILVGNLLVELDGRELPLRCLSHSGLLLDHVRCDYRFRADWQLSPERSHRLRVHEANWYDDRVSRLTLQMAASPELTVIVEPTAPDSELGRRTLLATIRAEPSLEAGLVRPGLPPDVESRPAAVSRQQRLAGRLRSDGPPTESILVHAPGPDSDEASARHEPLLDLLFDTQQGLLVLLVLAAAFGAVHALTPGHGKTMVAAYLVGQRGTIWHAFVLGLVTTLTHTAAVLILAAVLPILYPKAVPSTVQTALGLIGGLLIAGLGLWLLAQRLTGRADHIHLDSGSAAMATGSGSETASSVTRPTWWALIVLGITGGLVPCWDAVALLALAISTQRLWLGLPLLLAFSAGLAGVLVVLGIIVVRTRELAQRHLGEDPRVERILAALPLLSALLITVLGLWLCFESARGV